MTLTLRDRRILLVIAGGIAAYKSLDLIRRLRERGARVRCILTQAATEFVTPLAVAALTEDKVYRELFSLTDESEMGHIRLSRDADLLVVAPATANILARMAAGLADDLATTALLATDKPVLVAPAMNVRMWDHPATRDNLALLQRRGVRVVGPNPGEMACGEYGPGRMSEPLEIIAAIEAYFAEFDRFGTGGPLQDRHIIVTSGPTHEPIDPVRYIANRSSGKQGHAIAAALRQAGARVTLVTGPTHEPPPHGVTVVPIETADEMMAACRAALPADAAVCAAAVADWRVAAPSGRKIKKGAGGPPALALAENPDILATLSAPGPDRPALVVGFAAETEDVISHAQAKRARKGCDWILANDVSPGTQAFGGDSNILHLITAEGAQTWPRLSKADIGTRLAGAIARHFEKG
ncbi:bifunctional phosphopantothenoylcysteine decarboxylase/phosphopantothenate--cysteine ligase CoaBC [Inquilinus sp. Marseille-Q2685]|uniref:bifunctional phosphopantothenoylcysteine decarboxylase/phosphopantothenate--cysteine ligase CoaBC n=1 Tax=Inquilinus sp. Marseille-Q2685 TaxID=2866581 RepID=UPI001CE47CBE|nr:bifunctional phosphopantothenoylcysteine decarboxylase/phosphopantothenate--cysteine ligase CoaBC [Inquilinus sp. Marseille-Q2685]